MKTLEQISERAQEISNRDNAGYVFSVDDEAIVGSYRGKKGMTFEYNLQYGLCYNNSGREDLIDIFEEAEGDVVEVEAEEAEIAAEVEAEEASGVAEIAAEAAAAAAEHCYVARKSDHIEEDVNRNWSSWNFGAEGFEGTHEQLCDALDALTVEEDDYLCISGFEIRASDRRAYQFGELREGYWVAVDWVNSPYGLSCIDLDATDLEGAIQEALSRTDYFGDGSSFDAEGAKLVYSKGDIHVFEIAN